MPHYLYLFKSGRVSPFYLKHWKPTTRGVRFLHSTSSLRDYVIGIDVGTTRTRAALLMDELAPTMIESESGRALHSYVATDTNRGILVGRSAKLRAVHYPKDVFFNINHLIGRRFDDPHVQKLMTLVPYVIAEGANGDAVVKSRGKASTPTELLSSILRRIKYLAELYLGRSDSEVMKAVITVPPYFNEEQRKKTELAGRVAGFDVLRVIDEPIAAARCCCTKTDNGVVAICSFGGQFHVSILEIVNGVISVKHRNSDPFFGGKNFDLAIFHYILEEIKRVDKMDLSGHEAATWRLMEAVQKAKMELSSSAETEIYVYGLHPDLCRKSITFTRSKFEELVSHLLERTRAQCTKSLTDAGLSVNQVDQVILTGGMAKVPLIQRTVSDAFGKNADLWIEPSEVLAFGAALHGAFIMEDRRKFSPDTVSLSLGFAEPNGRFQRIIKKGTKIPANVDWKLYTSVDLQRCIQIRVFQGEHEKASLNTFLGVVELTDIPPLPAGVVSCDLIFDISREGVLTVSAESADIRKVSKTFPIPEPSEEHIRRRVKEALLTKFEAEEFYLRDVEREAIVAASSARIVLERKKYCKKHSYYKHAERALINLVEVLDSGNSVLIDRNISYADSGRGVLHLEKREVISEVYDIV